MFAAVSIPITASYSIFFSGEGRPAVCQAIGCPVAQWLGRAQLGRQKQLFPLEVAVLCCRFRVRDLNMFASCFDYSKDDDILGGRYFFDRRSNMKQNILLRVAPCGLLLVPLPPPFNSPSNKTIIFLQNDCYEFQDRNENTSSSKIASSAAPS